MKVKIGLAQTPVCADKACNIQTAKTAITALSSSDIIVLPEMWSCPYDNSVFRAYAEPDGGECYTMLSDMAKKYGKYIVGGSVPELFGGDIYNTSYVFDGTGALIAKHRKMHLFDINVTGGQSFCESAVLSAGRDVTVFNTQYCKIGLCICYDYRFSDLARLMVQDGAEIIIVPAAFNMTTGPAHWELLFRSRAVDNQVYCVGVAPARDEQGGYVSYAHSIVTSPWGDIVEQFGVQSDCKIVEVDLDQVRKVRDELPILKHRRTDIYELKSK